MRKFLLATASALTCFRWLPFCSAFGVSIPVFKSSREGFGRNQPPLHLLPEKEALMAAAAAAAKVQGDGFWQRIGLELVKYGGTRFLVTTVLAFASKSNRGIKLLTKTEDSEVSLRSELQISNKKLATSIEKFAIEVSVSNEKFATKTDSRIAEVIDITDKVSRKTTARFDKFASDTKLNNEKFATKTDTSIAELIVITETLARELKINNAKLSKLETKIENLNAEIHAMKKNVKRPKADSGSLKNITLDEQVEQGS